MLIMRAITSLYACMIGAIIWLYTHLMPRSWRLWYMCFRKWDEGEAGNTIFIKVIFTLDLSSIIAKNLMVYQITTQFTWYTKKYDYELTLCFIATIISIRYIFQISELLNTKKITSFNLFPFKLVALNHYLCIL